MSGILAGTYISKHWILKRENCFKFEASLGYIVSSMSAGSVEGDFYSKTSKNKAKNKKVLKQWIALNFRAIA